MKAADIHAEAVADARVPIWEKFIYLAPFAALTGAARLPIGPISRAGSRAALVAVVGEVAAVARAQSGSRRAGSVPDRVVHRPVFRSTTRSSLLIDLVAGKRIEVESLPGSRRPPWPRGRRRDADDGGLSLSLAMKVDGGQNTRTDEENERPMKKGLLVESYKEKPSS